MRPSPTLSRFPSALPVHSTPKLSTFIEEHVVSMAGFVGNCQLLWLPAARTGQAADDSRPTNLAPHRLPIHSSRKCTSFG